MSGDAGVRLVGHILRRLAEGARPTVDQVGRECAVARSTAFDVVDRLERAGFVVRDSQGHLSPGPASIALGFARFGLGRLHGPAEAALTWLRDQTGGDPRLSFGAEPDGQVILALGGCHTAEPARGHLSEPVRDRRGDHRATVTLVLGAKQASWELIHAQRCMRKVALTLARELDSSYI